MGVGEEPVSFVRETKVTLRQTTWWLAAVAFDWLLIAAAFAAVWATEPLAIKLVVAALMVPVISCRQHALLVLGHENVHWIVCRPRWLNDLLGDLLCMGPFGISVASYRKFHLAHHSHLGTLDDPEVPGREEFSRLGVRWQLPLRRTEFWREVALSLAGFRFYVMMLYLWSFRPQTTGARLLVVALWLVAGISCHLTGQWLLLAVWLWSMVTFLWAGFWFRIWTEHTGADGGTNRISVNWWQGFFLLPHNIWIHYEHHAFPRHQWWDLPRDRRELPGLAPVTLGELMRSFRERRSA